MASALRILIVDDDTSDRRLLRRAIERSGLPAILEEVGHIKGALQHISSAEIDCVVVDQHLPDGTATDFFALLDDRPFAAVVVTGLDDETLATTLLGAGADEYLSKDDVSPKAIRRSIRHAIERRKLRLELDKSVDDLQKMSAALEEANRALAALTLTDTLTKIPNRRAFETRYSQFRADAGRGRVFSLILGDIDHFKQVNDRFGHQSGDRVLVAVARALSDSARTTDYVARYGGEEFVTLAADTNEAGARVLAERMRNAIVGLSVDGIAGVSMSFGVCEVISGDETGEALFAAADKALYFAKEWGRNRTVTDSEIRLPGPRAVRPSQT